jgi:hypothetical protein
LAKITPEREPEISTGEIFNLGRLFMSIINSYNII